MGLNLNNGGNYKGHIRYMASTSSWSMSSENGLQNFQFTQMVFDLDNIKTGWCVFVEGMAPEWVMDESLTQMAAKPNDGKDWKRGFKIDVYSSALFGDEPVREFATSATGAVMGIDALYNQYEEQLPSNQGKVPVVEFKGSVPQKVGKGNTTVPTLNIVKWVDRPAELNGQEAQQPAQAQNNTPAPAQATGTGSEF